METPLGDRVVDNLAELENNLISVEKNKDYMALAFALQDEESVMSRLSRLEDLRETSDYRKTLVKAIKEFKKKVKWEAEALAKYGEQARGHFVDLDYHLDNKKRLDLLLKEARRLNVALPPERGE